MGSVAECLAVFGSEAVLLSLLAQPEPVTALQGRPHEMSRHSD